MRTGTMRILWLCALFVAVLWTAKAWLIEASTAEQTQPLSRDSFRQAESGGTRIGEGEVELVVFSSYRYPWCETQSISLDTVLRRRPQTTLVYQHVEPIGDSIAAKIATQASCFVQWPEFREFSRQAYSFLIQQDTEDLDVFNHQDWVDRSCERTGADEDGLQKASGLGHSLSLSATPTLLFRCWRHDGFLGADSILSLIAVDCK